VANKSKSKSWILVVDDAKSDRELLREILETEGYEVVCVAGIDEANTLIADNIKSDSCPAIMLIDYALGPDSGDVLARRTMDIVEATKVVMISGNIDRVAELPFVPDGKVIKEVDMSRTSNTLLGYIDRLLREPKRLHKFPPDVRFNLWNATSKMFGISDLTLLTREMVGKSKNRPIEKFNSRFGPDKWVVCQVCPLHRRDRFVTCSIQTTIGCNQLCPSCTYWRRSKDSGHVLLPLTAGMISAQVYQMFMNSLQLQVTFSDESQLGIDLEFTGEGDGLANNLDACVQVMWQFAEVKKPQFSFLLSSVGTVGALRKLHSMCFDLPRLSLVWSVYSVLPEIREKLIPASKGSFIAELADLWEAIGTKMGIKIRAAIPLFLGINDSKKDAKATAAFFKNRPFDVELIAGCSVGYSGHLLGVPSTPMNKVREHRRILLEEGLEKVLIRRTFGWRKGEYSGLGMTKPGFLLGSGSNK
jgi:adenine C2-methylase RlmN of 23S rRNA A2503 and tRNA A37/CheY-like chemotaxis protein